MSDDDQDKPSTALPALHDLAALMRSMPDLEAPTSTAPLPKVAFVPTTSTGPRVLPQLAALSSTAKKSSSSST